MLTRFPSELIEGRLIKRYKRFLSDVELPSGETVTAHCANPGSMLGLAEPGSRVWLSKSNNPKRKLAFSWELIEVDLGRGPALVGINTSSPNGAVAAAIERGLIPELSGYASMRREVRYGTGSRIDVLLEDETRPPCYVEIKNVHLMREPGLAEFPDSVTARGAKHLGELSRVVAAGARAVMVYFVQRGDAEAFALANDIDPNYAAAFEAAMASGIEALAVASDVSLEGLGLPRPIRLRRQPR
ncbi:DNA/RNA nuclease SfsA [Methyloceanibacter caenitepidi]|uniref:Sugar fermentation stimulation protein homolog n=1 Tax=Methyloceanibacter caenitepidi TaxID=1384459 RepID=A0A0A8K2Z7_9HYPH|nr:DNA/RNA nuclease SfsA [Methyloceanibacter caenitepidi]BAQ17181.1 sugar/maltose fermentation stimulation protein homolog [Methyloceanibacter caenitepidi]